ncbi:cysteine-rich KTR domain-containing protein [Monoglobus pectinilyticus]|uniref:cysteine-rich KTR domain-containing protein n=1 Tax=Monoglobus pectinilyticus TaxID=1981510 RepID=UPI00399B5C3C
MMNAIYCVRLWSKTCNKIRRTLFWRIIPYCPKCRQESLIKVDNLKITVIKEQTLKTQG